MRRHVFVRILLAMLGAAGTAGDTASKVVHGVVHLGEVRAGQFPNARGGASAHQVAIEAGGAAVEATDQVADHGALHAVSVAPRLDIVIATTSLVVLSVPVTAVITVTEALHITSQLARPPNPDGARAQPRAPPIG